MKFIETTEDLNQFCTILENYPFITVDLEFHREKTYYAKLALIQVACSNDEAIIDPLSAEINLERFFELLKNPKITKVFHSCRQDIEILYLLTGFIPSPLFDTQVAAQVCNFGTSISYENLVKNILKIDLDKSYRLTNWCARPLDKSQLNYAIADVTHLVHIYNYLNQKISENGRSHWIDEEMAFLATPQTYVVRPEDAWLKIKHHSHNAKYLTLLKALATWREERAQSKDLPRQTVIKDDCLLNIAATYPHNLNELAQIRNMRGDIVKGRLANEIIEIVIAIEKLSPEEYVKLPKEKKVYAPKELVELLKLLLNIKSQKEGVVGKLIASEDDLVSFAASLDNDLPLLKNWRYEVFGQDALKLRDGKLSICYNKEHQNIDITYLS